MSQLAAHSVLVEKAGGRVSLQLDAEGEPYRRPGLEEKLSQALSAYFGESIKIDVALATDEVDTPARQRKAAADDKLQNARASIDNDPNVRAMRDIFGATVQPDSVRPLD